MEVCKVFRSLLILGTIVGGIKCAYSIENQISLYQMPVPNDSILMQKITIRRNFNDICDLVDSLNKIDSLKAVVDNYNCAQPINYNHANPVMINLMNVSILEVIKQSSIKLGYSWVWENSSNTLKFYAINQIQNPLNPKINTLVESSAKSPLQHTINANSDNHSLINNNSSNINSWTYKLKDKNVSGLISKWAKMAGYQLIWHSKYDFTLQSSGVLEGEFKTVVNEVLKSFKNSEHPLKAEWYKNNVIVIKDMEGKL